MRGSGYLVCPRLEAWMSERKDRGSEEVVIWENAKLTRIYSRKVALGTTDAYIVLNRESWANRVNEARKKHEYRHGHPILGECNHFSPSSMEGNILRIHLRRFMVLITPALFLPLEKIMFIIYRNNYCRCGSMKSWVAIANRTTHKRHGLRIEQKKWESRGKVTFFHKLTHSCLSFLNHLKNVHSV